MYGYPGTPSTEIFEFIERRRDQGFGEGNFQALFESMERDQLRRGALSEEERVA